MVNAELQDDLRKEAQRLGFVACGFTSAAPNPQRAARLEEYLGEGRHGSMEWMEARKAQRASQPLAPLKTRTPETLPPSIHPQTPE